MSDVLLWAAAGLLVLMTVVLYQVVKQQGRILIRLDELQRRLHETRNAAGLDVDGEHDDAQGLPVGALLPPFTLPDLSGHMMDLKDFRGSPVLLTHWNPDCGFCDLIAPDLSQLQAALGKRGVQLLLVSSGSNDDNRRKAQAHRLECPILLENRSRAVDAFKDLGTPVAYLLDAHGRIAHSLAVGASEVLNLARRVAAAPVDRKRLSSERPLNESRILRDGLRAGTPAPSFTLPDLGGRLVSLEGFRGRRVLLVFSDPDCGPCDQLASYLAPVQSLLDHDRVAVVMVTRGDARKNVRKVAAYGLQFPVLLQRWWEISKIYGIFATPVAFLISEEGVVEHDVAIGPEEVMALAQQLCIAREEVKRNGQPVR